MRKYWPQIAVISLMVADTLHSIVLDGKPMLFPDYSGAATFVANAFVAALLWAGGFWDDKP